MLTKESKMIKCKICGEKTTKIFEKLNLNKYIVKYFKCNVCGFIFTENPYWLNEAYKSTISDMDIGVLYRNLSFSNIIDKILLENFDCKKDFLDYGGGYGIFTRLMRDKGFSYYSTDIYSKNLFAKYFDAGNLMGKSDYEVLTAFEVFEHLIDPIKEIRKMLIYSDTILFSTEIQPSEDIKELSNWWYFVPEIGQHISFYSLESLNVISKLLKLKFFTSGNLHILTKINFDHNPLVNDLTRKKDINNIESLMANDFNYIKKNMHKFVNNSKDIVSGDLLSPVTKKESTYLIKVVENLKEKNTRFKIEAQKDVNSIKELNESNSRLIINNDLLKEKLNKIEISKSWRILNKIKSLFSFKNI